MTKKIKLFRISTIALSLNVLLKGQLIYLSKFYSVTAISSQGDDLNEVKLRENVQIMPIEIKRNISLVNDLFSLFHLFIYFKKEKPLIVHSITPKAGLLSMIAGKWAGVPIRIHTFTGLVFPSKKGILKAVLIITDKLLCWACTNVYAEGIGVKSDLDNYKITKKDINIIGNGSINGIDCQYYNPSLISENERSALKFKLGIEKDDFVFLFVGRLVSDKGINELILAFKELNNVNAKLILVGSYEKNLDPLNADTFEIINKNSQIITIGFQSDVRKYFAISNSLVFPSYREGFPNVVLQAAAMGIPSIVTDINGCNEIIINDFNGIIIRKKSVSDLKEAMLSLINDREYCSYLGSNSRDLICSQYNQLDVLCSLEKEYEKLINNANN
jgi:glycosyltransferase involved in cell wall biosynthesis